MQGLVIPAHGLGDKLLFHPIRNVLNARFQLQAIVSYGGCLAENGGLVDLKRRCVIDCCRINRLFVNREVPLIARTEEARIINSL